MKNASYRKTMTQYSRYFYGGLAVCLLASSLACSEANDRGIADKRTDFSKFLPMTQNTANDGLKPVKPFFRTPRREQIMAAIERACSGAKAGSSVYEPREGKGYYVNCNPRNRQLLNGYVPANSRERPHSR